MIRCVGSDDVPALAAIIAQREGGDVAAQLQKLREELALPTMGHQRLLLVADIDGAVAGFARVAYCVPAPDAPPNAAPEGWYLGGIIVVPEHRRRGIGRELTRRRLQWLRDRGASEAWFVVNADNRASIDLHRPFGFREVTRDFVQRGVSFSGRGEGILFHVDLSASF